MNEKERTATVINVSYGFSFWQAPYWNEEHQIWSPTNPPANGGIYDYLRRKSNKILHSVCVIIKHLSAFQHSSLMSPPTSSHFSHFLVRNLPPFQRLTDLDKNYGCWVEGSGEGIVREFGMDMYTLLRLKWITNMWVQHMELCSMLCGNLDGRGVRSKIDTYICMAESLWCSPEIITTLFVNWLYFNKIKRFLKKFLISF